MLGYGALLAPRDGVLYKRDRRIDCTASVLRQRAKLYAYRATSRVYLKGV